MTFEEKLQALAVRITLGDERAIIHADRQGITYLIGDRINRSPSPAIVRLAEWKRQQLEAEKCTR